MTFHYDADLDQLAVRLVDRPSTESIEVRDGFVLDLDDEGNVAGFEVEHASGRVDLNRLSLGALPIDELHVSRQDTDGRERQSGAEASVGIFFKW